MRATRFPRGVAYGPGLFLGGTLILVGLLVYLMRLNANSASMPVGASETGGPVEPLLLYCAAGLREPEEAARTAFEQETGARVQVVFGPSETMLSQADLAKRGDLYLPADDSYLHAARQKGLVDEIIPLASQRPVIAVKKGNPKKIVSTADLARSDVTVILASPAAAVGKLAREVFKKAGEWEALERRKSSGSGVSELGSVTEVANALKIGAADAGIVWDATVEQYPELEAVASPALDASARQAAVGVLRFTKRPTAALAFARFLTARDRGLPEFKKRGYRVVNGDAWETRPEIVLFSGSMLRPAIEETLEKFKAREGCVVKTVYNGCGILVGQMETGARPDAYFSCDATFMRQVQALFDKAETIVTNSMVIAVAKGNPKGIKELSDLAKPGIKLGIGHEQQCALGFLTKEVLDKLNGCEAILKNVAVRSPTGDFLVNQASTGALDAVIVYQSNMAFAGEALDTIKVDLPQQFATQPIAARKDTPQKHLVERLFDAIRSEESKERFKALGFQWVRDGK